MALSLAKRQVSVDPASEKLERVIAVQAALVATEFDLPSFLELVARQVMTLTAASGAAVELVEGDEMICRAASGSLAKQVGLRLKRSRSLSGLCVAEGSILVSDDTQADSRVEREATTRVGAASMVVVPLYQRGEAAGALKVVGARPAAFDGSDIHSLQLMAGLLGGALGQQLEIDRRERLEERLRYVAQIDGLTDLPNRVLLKDRLAQAVARRERTAGLIALMYVDLDCLKRVNAAHGHAGGDALLKAFAGRVRNVLRRSDTLARVGGDEFVVVVEDMPALADVQRVAQAILDATSLPFELEGMPDPVKIGVSVGVAVGAAPGVSASELMQNADDALDRVKKAGGHAFEVTVLRPLTIGL